MRHLVIAAVVSALAGPVLAQPAPTPDQAYAPTSENCFWLMRRDGKLDRDEAPGLRLLETTGPIERPATTGQIQGIYCVRDSLVPAEWDDRVPRTLGVPLFINAPGGMTTVEIKDRRFAVSFSNTTQASPALRAAAKAMIDRWQARP